MGQPYSVGASIGIAFYPADGQTSEDLIKRTDIAMYQAKASGGGYRLYQAEMGIELEKRLTIAKKLGHAMEAGELKLYYQPQIDLPTGRVMGAEALLCWIDPVLGFIGPGEFIPIAEERGMMGPLGDWVLKEACRQVNAWAEQTADSLRALRSLPGSQTTDVFIAAPIGFAVAFGWRLNAIGGIQLFHPYDTSGPYVHVWSLPGS